VIKHYRLSAGLNQSELADQLAVTQTMVSRWEAGGANPSRRIQDMLFDYYWSTSATISRDVWYERLRRNPVSLAVVEASGLIRAVSRGFLRHIQTERNAIETHHLPDIFSGDLVKLYETLVASGFFEGRVSSAESVTELVIENGHEQAVHSFCHGIHRPVFMPGPEVLWLIAGAPVSATVFRDVRRRIGGPVLVKRAL